MDEPGHNDGELSSRDAQLQEILRQLHNQALRLDQIERRLGLTNAPVTTAATGAAPPKPQPPPVPAPAPGPPAQPYQPRPFPAAAPIPPAGYAAPRPPGPGLAGEFASLRSHLKSIGEAVSGPGAVTPPVAGAPAPGPPAAAAPAPGTIPTPPVPPFGLPPVPQPAPPRSQPVDWENLIGGKWALWVGSVAVFVAVALFLAYTWVYLPPVARVAMGFVAGGMCLAGGYWARGRGEAWFSEGLSGAGLGLLYLSTWAAVHQYGLLSFELAFVLMAATTALGVGLAIHYDAVSLIGLSTLGGFLTPAVLNSTSAAPGSPYPFMIYLTVLNAGILVVTLFKRWDGIKWLSFIATTLLVAGWALPSYTTALRWPYFVFVTVLFEMFLGAACFYSVSRKEPTQDNDLLLLCADAFVYGVAGYAILGNALGAYPGALAAALSLAFLGLYLVVRVMAPENAALKQAAAGLALFYLTIAVPIQLKEGWITIAWSVQAAVLFTLGVRLQSAQLRRTGGIVWCLSLVPLAGVLLVGQPRLMVLFVNERALPLLVSALASAWMAAVGRVRAPAPAPPAVTGGLASAPIGTQTVFCLWAVAGGAWLIAQETHLGLSWHQWPSAGTWETGALYVTAILWCGYALLTYGLGSWLHHINFRMCSFIVLALAVALPLWAGIALSVTGWTPFWNLRWLSYVVVSLTLAALGWLIAREQQQVTASEREAVGGLPLLISLLVLWGVTLEVYASFEQGQFPTPASWQTAALFAIAGLWSIYAGVMLLLSFAWQQIRWRVCAYALGALATGLLLRTAATGMASGWPPLANARFLAFAVVTALLVMTTVTITKRRSSLKAAEAGMATPIALLAVGLVLWGLTQETFETCRFYSDTLGSHWDLWAQMAISLVWTVCGAAMLVGGIARAYRPIRLAALGLLSLTVLKVFLFDLGFLDTPLRIASFGGLGLALIFISWLYSRYGLDQHQTHLPKPPLGPGPQPLAGGGV